MASVVINGDTSGAVTISAPAVAGTTTLTLPTTSGTILQSGTAVTEAQGGTGTTTGYYGFKNRIINGAMVIDQRNAGASVTPVNDQYSLDRWSFPLSQASKLTVQQNAGAVTPPVGFSNYLGVTSSSAYSITSTDYFLITQNIEGFNTSDFAFGTANAKTITLSFQVYSSLTGTFGGTLRNSAGNRSYPFTYTISSANTWTSISVTIAGDTSGTWVGATNGIGLRVAFSLGVGTTYSGTAGAWAGSNFLSATGATSVVGTNGATFYITGVQLEKGSTATSFDYRPYTTELQLCQRYYFQSWGFGAWSTNIGQGYAGQVLPSPNNASTIGSSSFPVAMRASPTVTTFDSLGVSGTVSQAAIANGIAATAGGASISGFNSVTKSSTTFTVGTPVACQFTASIEL
jgi:hypothetical protein